MPGRRTASPLIPCPSKALGSQSWLGECPIDSEELEINHLLPSSPLYDPPWGMAEQTLPFHPCSCRSDFLLQPACLWVRGALQPLWAGYIWAWYILEARGTVLTAWVCKIFLQNWFLSCLLGKRELIQHRMSCSFFCPRVVVFVCLARHRWAFQELFLVCGRQWISEGYLCMADCRDHSLRHCSLTLAANSSSIPVTLVQNS